MLNSRARKIMLWALGGLLAGGLLAWGGIVFFGRKPPARGPYWRRNDWISKVLLDLTSGPKGLPAIRVPDGFQVELAAGPALVSYPMFASFDDRGRLFVCESAGKNISDQEMEKQPQMRVRLLEDDNGDGVFDRSKVFADKLSMAMGVQWHRGSLYVAAPPDILRFEDRDGDGVADHREVILTGWPLHSNGTTLHGPYLGPDGWMYLTYNLGRYKIKTKEGGLLEGPGGRVFRFRPDGTGLEWFIGGGFDNAIEMVFTPAGEMIAAMTYYTNPRRGERDALLHFIEGGVYPKRTPIVDKYKRTGDLMPALTKFARIAPSGLARHSGAGFGSDYQGNLFSAQFNPHRIQRHILERDGATFRSKDEDFLTSEDLDFHPTDVTEDADGSLLVVETGAWYLHSCPVSRIAKPEVSGAIYRIRRKGAPPIADSWGNQLRLQARPPEELARLLDDGRPAVREKALDLLIQAGEAAVEPLARVRERHASPEVRAAAVFALSRIGGGHSAAAARAGLGDPHVVVRVAAAHMAGLNRDREALGRLMEMVQRDEPPARRQAATALGRIGDTRAAPALVAASAKGGDRFVEHAVIYSLITLGTPGPLIEALKDRSPRARKAALIALDQMDGAPLRREHLASFLDDSDAELRRAALWVISHHGDWAGEVVKFMQARLRRPNFSAEEADAVRETLLSFCQDGETQRIVAGALGDLSGGAAPRALLLDVIEQCSVKEFPAVWAERLREHLRGADAAARARVVALIRARQLAVFDEDLERIAATESESDELRARALGALVSRSPALREASFQFLLRLLRPQTEADLRLLAAQVLGRTKLSERQLVDLAGRALGAADALILPSLLEAFRGASAGDVGQALVAGLVHSPHSAAGVAGERLPELLASFPPRAQAAAKPLLARIQKEKESRAERLRALESLLSGGGDIDRGRAIFFGKKTGCSSCHTLMEEGEDVGPDLTGIGAIRSRLDLIEAIAYPSASFVPGHEVFRVETAGEVYTGVQGEGTPDTLVLISGPHERVRIPRQSIVSTRPSLVSLMPDGFADNLSRQEFTDLLAFLQAQKYREAAANQGR